VLGIYEVNLVEEDFVRECDLLRNLPNYPPPPNKGTIESKEEEEEDSLLGNLPNYPPPANKNQWPSTCTKQRHYRE
jgi:hypothetical protein